MECSFVFTLEWEAERGMAVLCESEINNHLPQIFRWDG